MNFFSYIADAWNTIISNKLRSTLSSLGIIIWVSSVVILLSLWAGTKAKLLENMWSMVNNNITISKSSTASSKNRSMISSFGGSASSSSNWSKNTQTTTSSNIKKNITIDGSTVSFLEETFPDLSGKIWYTKATMLPLWWKTESVSSATVTWIPVNYFSLAWQEVQYWSNFSEDDIKNSTFYAIVNYSSISALFDWNTPLWEQIKVWNKYYTVIWVLKETTTESMTPTKTAKVYIPISTMMERVVSTKEYDSLTVYLDTQADNDSRKNIIQYALMKKAGATTISEVGFSLSSTASFVETLQETMSMFTYFLAAIGWISLLVWGIWVMNIMIVSVTERTREIGIRKAIWALRKDIIMQFLIESIVITLLWWLIALWISFGVAYLINNVLASSSISCKITRDIVWLALWLTTATGIIFGILPANKAAKLKPIDALRFE